MCLGYPYEVCGPIAFSKVGKKQSEVCGPIVFSSLMKSNRKSAAQLLFREKQNWNSGPIALCRALKKQLGCKRPIACSRPCKKQSEVCSLLDRTKISGVNITPTINKIHIPSSIHPCRREKTMHCAWAGNSK